jgi:hypothetical protein
MRSGVDVRLDKYVPETLISKLKTSLGNEKK